MKNKFESLKPGGDTPERPYSWERENFSPEVNKFFERYTEGDPNVELVSMNDGNSVEVGPDDEEKIIFTHSLGGCYGILVFTEHEDGRRNGVLTHYDPTHISENMTKLRELIGQNAAMKDAKIKQTVIVMETGEYVKDSETKKWELEPDPTNERAVDGIVLAIKAELGGDVEVKSEPYSRMHISGLKDQSVLIARILSKNGGEANYQTPNGIKNFSKSER